MSTRGRSCFLGPGSGLSLWQERMHAGAVGGDGSRAVYLFRLWLLLLLMLLVGFSFLLAVNTAHCL